MYATHAGLLLLLLFGVTLTLMECDHDHRAIEDVSRENISNFSATWKIHYVLLFHGQPKALHDEFHVLICLPRHLCSVIIRTLKPFLDFFSYAILYK